jgi:hypothetical protein
MPTLAAHAARRHEPPTQKSTKQTPAHAAASNFARTLLLASVSMHCWHIIAAAALSSTQQTHDALAAHCAAALGRLRAALTASRSTSAHSALDATRANTIGQS